MKIAPGGDFTWVRPFISQQDKLPFDEPTRWSVTNVNDKPAKLQIHMVTSIVFPEVRIVPNTAIAFVILVGLYLGFRFLTPKVAAIAVTTAKEAMSQPLFYLVMGLGAFSLVRLHLHSVQHVWRRREDAQGLGPDVIMVLGDHRGRVDGQRLGRPTKSKAARRSPCSPSRFSRRQFILGKFLGMLGPVVVLFVVLGCCSWSRSRSRWCTTRAKSPRPSRPGRLCYLEMIAHGARPGAGVFRDGGAGGDQRGDLHAAADAGEPDHLRVDLRAGPPGADARQLVGRPVRDRAVRRPVYRHGAAGARPLQHPSRGRRRRGRAAELPWHGAAVLRALQHDRHAAWRW